MIKIIFLIEINQHENHKENIIVKIENGKAISEEGITNQQDN